MSIYAHLVRYTSRIPRGRRRREERKVDKFERNIVPLELHNSQGG